uniref:THD domain-containing protein n=1 Tax=Magallana gigas TaxID=29159 RepID=A0A8W8IRM4_MAGGI
HQISVDLPAKEGNDFPLSEFLKERRVKRRVFKKGSKGKRRHKPKLTGLQVVGFQEEHRPNETLSGTFHKWQYADWFFKSNADDKHFKLHFGNGTLEVMQPGLYLLYSQITLKGNGTQGYHVMRNDKDPILACYSNNMMLHEEDKTSCFTMGMFKLDKRDIISVKHISTSGVRAVFTSNASFFGLVRLGRFNKRGVVLAV